MTEQAPKVAGEISDKEAVRRIAAAAGLRPPTVIIGTGVPGPTGPTRPEGDGHKEAKDQ